MLSPILYTLLWVLGGMLVPGYSHIRDDVSSFYAVDAYLGWFFQSLIIISSSLLLIFYIGLHRKGTDLLSITIYRRLERFRHIFTGVSPSDINSSYCDGILYGK
jgi:hypothetical protein